MSSIFTKIIRGEIPAYKVAETKDFFAFLDIEPKSRGHTLCVPKKEVDKLFDLDKETYLGLMLFSRRIAKAIAQVIDCNRVGLMVYGLDVPHSHVHLFPLYSKGDKRYKAKVSLSDDEFKSIAKELSVAFDRLSK